jgi:hypothetical protein
MELTGLDVLKVRALPGTFDYAKGTKMEGKTYRRFTTGGKVFISNDDTFVEALSNGGLHTVVLGTDEEDRLMLNDFITWKQVLGQKRNAVEFESITVESFKLNSVAQYEAVS